MSNIGLQLRPQEIYLPVMPYILGMLYLGATLLCKLKELVYNCFSSSIGASSVAHVFFVQLALATSFLQLDLQATSGSLKLTITPEYYQSAIQDLRQPSHCKTRG